MTFFATYDSSHKYNKLGLSCKSKLIDQLLIEFDQLLIDGDNLADTLRYLRVSVNEIDSRYCFSKTAVNVLFFNSEHILTIAFGNYSASIKIKRID